MVVRIYPRRIIDKVDVFSIIPDYRDGRKAVGIWIPLFGILLLSQWISEYAGESSEIFKVRIFATDSRIHS